ncbi:MAG: rod shape-determining protein MreC [Kiritimatiellae bacterium]|nr:rod shape-determining protein MreC [Kiritimatiellia bacterium]
MTRWSRVWGLCLGLTVVLLLFGGTRRWVHRAAREGIYPFENSAAWVKRQLVDRFPRVWRSAALTARNQALEAEVARLRVDAALMEQVAAENRELRRQMGTAQLLAWGRLEPCVTLSRGGATGWWRQLRINKGSDHGVAIGDAVLAPDGLVGRVVDLSANTAEVRLITDAHSRIACRLDPAPPDAGGVYGVLHGSGWRAGDPELPEMLYVIEPLRLRYLERDVTPAPRTRVVTSGLGGGLPAGLLVGYLLASEVDENGLYRMGDVMPAADLRNLPLLFVLTGRSGGP